MEHGAVEALKSSTQSGPGEVSKETSLMRTPAVRGDARRAIVHNPLRAIFYRRARA
jgi:hypothetical protein